MVEAGRSAEEVENWSSNVEGPIAEADGGIAAWRRSFKTPVLKEAEHQKQRDEEERRARAREEELKFERTNADEIRIRARVVRNEGQPATKGNKTTEAGNHEV